MTEIGKLDDLLNLIKLAQDLEIGKLLASAIASLAGAYFAFKFAMAATTKRNYSTEVQATNYAFSVVYSYFNSAHNIKKQLLLPKVAELENVTRRLEELHSNTPANQQLPILQIVEFKNTFLEMQPVEFMIGTAVKSLSSLQYMTGRPMIFSFQLEKAAASLNNSILEHNATLLQLKELKDDQEIMFRVCGLVLKGGSVDAKYRHQIEACVHATDDLLYFSFEIMKNLTAHIKRLKELNGDKLTPALRLDPEDQNDDLLPLKENYKSWDKVPVIFTNFN